MLNYIHETQCSVTLKPVNIRLSHCSTYTHSEITLIAVGSTVLILQPQSALNFSLSWTYTSTTNVCTVTRHSPDSSSLLDLDVSSINPI